MILIDTTPLVALCDLRDSLNKTALKHLKVLAKSQFAICEPVLAEACFHLSGPSQRNRLQQTLERFGVLPVPVDSSAAITTLACTPAKPANLMLNIGFEIPRSVTSSIT